MSDCLPFDIQKEIMKRLPVKSLIQFRSVSKEWKSLIDSSRFIIAYHRHTEVQRLLVRHVIPQNTGDEFRYVSIVDNDAFPEQKASLTSPVLVNSLMLHRIIGCSHGCLCFLGFLRHGLGGHLFGTKMVVIWNPSIRKSVGVIVPKGDGHLRFGVCGKTADPKLLRISKGGIVEVFTLSTGAWRSPYSNNSSNSLPGQSIEHFGSQVAASDDGFLYWLAREMTTVNGEARFCNLLIVSFNLTSEEFGQVHLPDCLAAHDVGLDRCIYISMLKNSLVVLEPGYEDGMGFVLWMMEDGLFKKLFNIYIPFATLIFPLVFRTTGEAVVLIDHQHEQLVEPLSLVAYEPHSKHATYLGFNGTNIKCSVHSYVETLVLLDHPDFIIYDNGNRYNLDAIGDNEEHTSKMEE